MIWWV